MYFCAKFNFMKNVILFGILFFLLALFSSCGIYQEPCEGVADVQQKVNRL